MSARNVYNQIGQLVIAGFQGVDLPVELRALARDFDLGGIVIFRRNVEAPEQVADLARQARLLTKELPLWISVDQEGGRVARLQAPFTLWPPMATLGRAGDVGLAERFARAMAAELTAVGISLDFAPVLDVHTNPANPVIGDRALSDRADEVARLGRVIIETLQANGVASCGKHFPGHGDTSVDSHLELPVVEHSRERLDEVELVPFRAAVAARVAAIMTAHVLVPALDEGRPATLSSPVLGGLLRGSLGYEGLILSDDLEMRAITLGRRVEAAAVEAVAAGCDALLVCSGDSHRLAAVLEALVHAVETGGLTFRRVEDALTRQRLAKGRFLATNTGGPLQGRALEAVVGCDRHRAIANEMSRWL